MPTPSGSASWLRPLSSRSARAVEHILILSKGYDFSLCENGGQDRIRTCEGVSQRIYSPPRLATSVPTRLRISPMPCSSYWLAVSAKRGWIVMDFITIFARGKSLLSVGWLLMKSSTSKPSSTSPKTVYLPSSFGKDVNVT
jgi:hypothetical protein